MVGSWVKRFAIDLFGRYHFRLVFLFLEDGVSEFIALVEYGYPALRILADGDLDFDQCIGGTIGLDLVDDIFELDGQVLGDQTGFLPGQDLVKVLVSQQGPMGIQGTAWRDSKAGIEIGDELGQVGIALLHVVDPQQAHLLDQATRAKSD